MNEHEINCLLESIPNYLGTFALDEVKNVALSAGQRLLIINLDKRDGTGSHWIALAITLKSVYICDSLGGILPSAKHFPQELVNFLSHLAKTRNIFLTRQLQPSSSTLCGLYCVVFIMCMAEKKSFFDFVTLFTRDLKQNDTIVRFLLQGQMKRYIRSGCSFKSVREIHSNKNGA